MPTTISGNTGVSQVQAGSITAADLDGAQTGSAPIYGCRAWVNFDGTKDSTGATSTANTNRLILGSGNVTSVLRNGTGNYTITFTTAMPDANFAGTITVPKETLAGFDMCHIETKTTTSCGVRTGFGGQTTSYTNKDYLDVSLSIFR